MKDNPAASAAALLKVISDENKKAKKLRRTKKVE